MLSHPEGINEDSIGDFRVEVSVLFATRVLSIF